MVKKWNRNELMEFSQVNGITWAFNKAADAPWENGCSEALIRLVKRGIGLSIGESTLTYGELQTVLFNVANLLNERPIGCKPGCDPELGSYLSPNDLLLGRTSNDVPVEIWNECASSTSRLQFLNRVTNNFWKRWLRDYWPTLIVQQKWHTSRRNIRKGDLVLIQDHNIMKGVWKRGIVTEATPGSDGRVRDVTVRYANVSRSEINSKITSVKRSVHKLMVLMPVEET